MKLLKYLSFFAVAATSNVYAAEGAVLTEPSSQTATPVTTPSTKKKSEIQYSLDKDGRKWKVGYEAKNQDQSIQEFVQGNETVDNWTELFTVHHYYNLPSIDLDKYNEAFISELQKIVPNSKIEHRIINKGQDSLFGEWWLNDGTPQSQHEWFKVFTNDHDVIVLRYTTRKLDDIESARKKWEAILNDAHLSSPKQ